MSCSSRPLEHLAPTTVRLSSAPVSLCFDSGFDGERAGPGRATTTDTAATAESGFAEVLTGRPRSLLVGSATAVGTVSLNAFKVQHVVSLQDAAVGSGLGRDADVRYGNFDLVLRPGFTHFSKRCTTQFQVAIG